MQLKFSKKLVRIKWLRGHHTADRVQMAIIFAFFLMSTLVSLWLPIYFGLLALRQGL